MNKITLLITLLAFGLVPGLTSKVEARHQSSQQQVFISGYQRCGTPIYKVRYIAGYDCRGHAIWRVRHLARGEYRSCQTLNKYRRHARYYENRIRNSGSRGRGYTCHQRAVKPCRRW